MFTRHQLGQVFVFLFLRTPTVDLVHAQIGVRPVRQADRRRGAANFLDRNHMVQIAKAQPAPLFFHRDAVQAQFAHGRPQVAREPVLGIHLGRQRCNHLVGKAGRGFTDHHGTFGQAEIKIGRGAHGTLSLFSLSVS